MLAATTRVAARSTAIAVRRAEGIPRLIDLLTSADRGVQLAAVSAQSPHDAQASYGLNAQCTN